MFPNIPKIPGWDSKILLDVVFTHLFVVAVKSSISGCLYFSILLIREVFTLDYGRIELHEPLSIA